MRAKTDSQGRFQIRYLSTQMTQRRAGNRQEQQYVPRPWQIRCGPTSKSIMFDDGISTVNVELVLKPSLQAAPSLVGSTLPKFQGLGIDVRSEDIEDQKVLLCFFDMNQRPARRCVTQLARQAEQLKQKDVTVIAIQASEVDESALNEWIKKQNIPFPVGMIEGDEENIHFNWGVRSLPWLILTDRHHIVQAEGFGVEEVADKIKNTAK
jgi:peroxiredoxin